ncbi:MAG: hypothetical protein J6W00_05575 [Lentisphaeria bacterium]|nr:hypothetical protein [Lentisphaeria bacterium]
MKSFSSFLREMMNTAVINIIAGISMPDVEKNTLPIIAEKVPMAAGMRLRFSLH